MNGAAHLMLPGSSRSCAPWVPVTPAAFRVARLVYLVIAGAGGDTEAVLRPLADPSLTALAYLHMETCISHSPEEGDSTRLKPAAFRTNTIPPG